MTKEKVIDLDWCPHLSFVKSLDLWECFGNLDLPPRDPGDEDPFSLQPLSAVRRVHRRKDNYRVKTWFLGLGILQWPRRSHGNVGRRGSMTLVPEPEPAPERSERLQHISAGPARGNIV